MIDKGSGIGYIAGAETATEEYSDLDAVQGTIEHFLKRTKTYGEKRAEIVT